MTPQKRMDYATDPRVVGDDWMAGVREDFAYYPETGELYRVTGKGRRLVASKSKAGRLVTSYKGRVRYATRIIWAFVYGRHPIDVIDHVNGNRADNRMKNLRECTQAENNRNRRGSVVAATGLRGVRQLPSGKFQARISSGGKTIGTFNTAAEAARAYEAEARRRFAEFFPQNRLAHEGVKPELLAYVQGIGEASR